MATPPSEKIYTSAILCEKILKEKSGILSLIQMMDIAQVDLQGGETPAAFVARLDAELFVTFKSVGAVKFIAVVTIVTPDGNEFVRNEYPIQLTGAPHGHSLTIQLVLNLSKTGIFWFNVSIDGGYAQRLPLWVRLSSDQTHETTQAEAAS